MTWEWFDNASKIFAVPALAAVSGVIFSYLFLFGRYKWRGSRRSPQNWRKGLQSAGDPTLLRLGAQRVIPDTLTTEGDAASVYYLSWTGFHYEVIDGVRKCFLRSYVRQLFAYYEWCTERKLGENIMTQFCTEPIPCMGLEARTDTAGNEYWVMAPVADIPVPADLTARTA